MDRIKEEWGNMEDVSGIWNKHQYGINTESAILSTHSAGRKEEAREGKTKEGREQRGKHEEKKRETKITEIKSK